MKKILIKPDELKQQLDKRGFIRISGFLNDETIQKLRRHYMDRFDYSAMTEYVQQSAMPRMSQLLCWKDICCGMIFMSDNNNPHTIHRDFHINDSKAIIPPIYTALIYLDNTKLVVVPGTHNVPRSGIFTMKNTTELDVQTGDLIIIHSHILHKGFFDEQTDTGHRRTLQMVQIFPDKETYVDTMKNTNTRCIKINKKNKKKTGQQARFQMMKYFLSHKVTARLFNIFAYAMYGYGLHNLQISNIWRDGTNNSNKPYAQFVSYYFHTLDQDPVNIPNEALEYDGTG